MNSPRSGWVSPVGPLHRHQRNWGRRLGDRRVADLQRGIRKPRCTADDHGTVHVDVGFHPRGLRARLDTELGTVNASAVVESMTDRSLAYAQFSSSQRPGCGIDVSERTLAYVRRGDRFNYGTGRNTQIDAGCTRVARTARYSRSVSGEKSPVRAPPTVARRATLRKTAPSCAKVSMNPSPQIT
jgi:hypothetical protein